MSVDKSMSKYNGLKHPLYGTIFLQQGGLVSSASNQNILILFSIPFGTAQLNPVKIFYFTVDI